MYNHIFFSYQKPTLCKVGFFSDYIESVLKPNVDTLTQIESERLIFPTIKIESVPFPENCFKLKIDLEPLD